VHINNLKRLKIKSDLLVCGSLKAGLHNHTK